MSRIPTLMTLAAVLLAAGGLDAQEEKAPAKPAVETTAKEVLALLDKAIAHQGPAEWSKPDAIQDLTVRLQAEIYDYSHEPAERNTITISRYLKLSPRKFRSEWKPIGDRMISGYDGRRYWYAEYKSTGALSESKFLMGDTYKSDRQRIQDEIEETRYLLRFFFLANLKGDEVLFTQKKDEKVDAFGAKDCFVLHRENRKEGTSEPPLTLYLEKKSLNLVQATAHATKEGRKSLTFAFRYSEAVQPRVKGVLFPFKMELHEKSFGAKESRIASKATLLENGIRFNTGLSDKLFLAPKPPKRTKPDEPK